MIARNTPKNYICKGYIKHSKLIKWAESHLCGIIEKAIDLGIFGRGADLSHLDEKIDIKKAVVVLAKSMDFRFPFSVFYPFGSASEMNDADILMSLRRTWMFPEVSWWEYGGMHMYDNPDYQGFLSRDDAYRLIGSLFSWISISTDMYILSPYSDVAFLFPDWLPVIISLPEGTSNSSGQILFSTNNKAYATFGYHYQYRYVTEQALNNLYEIDLQTKKIVNLFDKRSAFYFVNGKMVYVANNAFVVRDLDGTINTYPLPEELHDKIIAEIMMSDNEKTLSFHVFMWRVSDAPSRLYKFNITKNEYTLEQIFEPYFGA